MNTKLINAQVSQMKKVMIVKDVIRFALLHCVTHLYETKTIH
jgi:hypothetical protein